MSSRVRIPVPVGPRDHIRGAPAGPALLVEYGDFECPRCGAAQAILESIRQELGDQLAFVYRHFPISDVHPFAMLAAEASEAAAARDCFWEMHDILFANQDALQPDDLMAYAQALDLDVSRFADELSAHTWRPRVQDDFAGGLRSGVHGTPTFFINSVRYDGPLSLPDMLAALLRVHD